MSEPAKIFEYSSSDEKIAPQGLTVNFKRIFSNTVAYWYLVLLSLLVALGVAFVVNRYATRIFNVSASIIVREGNENAGAEFLYKNNPLVNPYRNFYNELYIMRSYPLLQQVVESLNFSVIWSREGNIKSMELYDPEFPLSLRVLGSRSAPWGKSMLLTVENNNSFSLQYLNEEEKHLGESFSGLRFNDTTAVNGYQFLVSKRGKLPPSFLGKAFTIRFSNPQDIAKMDSDKLVAKWAEQGASVIDLSFSGPLPEKDIDFLTRFIERYQQYDVDKKNIVATKSIQFLDDQLTAVGDSLNYFDTQIKNFKQQHFVTNFEGEAERIFERIEELEKQRSQLVLYDNYLSYLENYIQKSSEFDQIVPPSAVGISDQILTGLISQLTEVQFSIRMLGNLQNEENPLVVERRDRILQLRSDILEGVKSVKAAQNINRDFITRQIKEEEKGLVDLPQNERIMVDIRRSYTIRENMYLFLMQKRVEAGISLASTTTDVLVVNPPHQKGGAMTPKPAQNYLVAGATGLFIPFLIFFLLELTNNKIQSKEDIEQFTTVPIIGGIGHKSLGENNLIVFNKPKSALAESFRALRSNLNYFTQGKSKKIIMITSSVSGEGKTFTTINLATTMAFANNQVLIIGADMRRPGIFADFELQNEHGLSTYLSGMAELDAVVQPTQVPNLYLMSGGPVPPNPSELLMLPRMQELLNELLKRFDFILLDTPPIGLVSDAFSLMSYADHVVFMVRQDYTPKNFVGELHELVKAREQQNVSILFNDIKKTGPGYGYGYNYYGYGYGYGYGYRYGRNSKRAGGYYTES
ncbi:MAG: polysaccharide biosynthesis tyrosine autokinase [Cyclobacteriaceae bacterium]